MSLVFIRDIDSPDVAVSLARRLQNEVRHAFSGDLNECVTLSIGIAMFPDHGKDFSELYKAVDSALYQVKTNGRNDIRVYEDQV